MFAAELSYEFHSGDRTQRIYIKETLDERRGVHLTSWTVPSTLQCQVSDYETVRLHPSSGNSGADAHVVDCRGAQWHPTLFAVSGQAGLYSCHNSAITMDAIAIDYW